MTKVLVTEDYLTDIADAIREKKGTAGGVYTPAQMGPAIRTLADEPVLVSKSVTANGSYSASSDNADGYSSVNVNVTPDLGTKSITENGTYSAASDSLDGYSEVTVNVAGGGFSAADEGKVVSNGALVSQTSLVVTENGTYDTTTKNSVSVNVSGGGAPSGSSLPAAYQEVEYIQLYGSQFIQVTDFVAFKHDFAYVKALSDTDTTEQAVFGFGSLVELYFPNASNPGLSYYSYPASDFVSIKNPISAVRTSINSGIGQFKNNYGASSPYSSSYATASNGLSIGCYNGSKYFLKGRIYSVTFSRVNDIGMTEYTYRFVPCYRKSDGEIGLYETVNGIFYTNRGSGSFGKGSDV